MTSAGKYFAQSETLSVLIAERLSYEKAISATYPKESEVKSLTIHAEFLPVGTKRHLENLVRSDAQWEHIFETAGLPEPTRTVAC